MAEVTQADREAADRLIVGALLAGGDGSTYSVRTPSVQEAREAFGRHRTEAVKPLVEALENVVAPLTMLQREAEARGNRLSGAAYSIANDLGFVQKIARDALAALRSVQS